jgi:ABC-type Fe3+-hydroxamate transport system substrate-binding protein
MGAVNATAAKGWPELSLEDVLRLDPEAIVLVRDSGPPGIDPVEAAGALAFLNTTARRHGRIAVLFHPDALLPSSAVIGVAAEMQNLLGRLAQEPE